LGAWHRYRFFACVFGLLVGAGVAPWFGGGQRAAHSLTTCRTWPRLDLLAGNRNM
jgi:hypothetical protein